MNATESLDDFPAGLVACDEMGRITKANATMLSWMEIDDLGALLGKPFYTLLTPAGRIYFETHVRPMLILEGQCHEIALELQSGTGTRRHVYLTASARPGSDGDGVASLHLVCFDGSERHKYERELLTQRRKAEAYEAIIAASPDAIVNIDPNLEIQSWNKAAEHLLGFTAEEALGQPAHPLVIADAQLAESRELLAQVAEGNALTVETLRKHKDGTLIPIELSIAPIRNERGEFAGTAGILRDITERKRAQQTIETLNREVLHRSKNLLTVVQGIAAMTQRHSPPGEFLDTFRQRLGSLGNNLTLLVARNWTSIDLQSLVVEQLNHLGATHKDRLVIGGPAVNLSAAKAEAVGMAIFELSTNALKYGAFSNPEGRVKVHWSVGSGSKGKVSLTWSETGVQGAQEPQSSGFGSMLTGSLLEAAVDGEVEATFGADGLTWTCRFVP